MELERTTTLRKAIARIIEKQPKLKRALIDPERDDIGASILILVNGKEISVLQGLDSKIKDGDELILIPVVHGG